MAKIKFGMMMTDARGKLGGQVFSKNRSGAYVRTKVTPSNARSARQTFIRATLSRISANWSTLTKEQREGFNSAVEQWQSTNIFGDVVKPTGKTLFVKLNINLANTQQAEINAVPEKSEMPQLVLTSVENDGGLISLNFSGNQVGIKILVFATAPQSQGTGFFKGKYRQLGVITGSASGTVDITTMYEEKFGTPDTGANINFQVVVVLPSGQASVPQSRNMIKV